MREAIDAGWRALWWYHLEHDLTLLSLHGHTGFEAMIEEVRLDMDRQRPQALEILDRSGQS